MEAGTAAVRHGKQLSLRELELHSDLIMDLCKRPGSKFKDLQQELRDRGIYASKKTIRNARENLALSRYIRGDHKKRMIGIHQRWKERGRNVRIKYKGKEISTAQIKRAMDDKRKKDDLDDHALIAMESYSGATPKEIFYYDPIDPGADLLRLDDCLWEASDTNEAIGYLSEQTLGQNHQMSSRSQMLPTSTFSQLAVPIWNVSAHQNQLGSEAVTTASNASVSIWEWVAMAGDTTDMLSGGFRDSMRQRALELYTKYSGNSSYDPSYMETLSEELLDIDQLAEADEVVSFGVILAGSLHKSTDIPPLLARSKLAYVRNQEGKYSEAYQIGQAAVDGLKIKCGEYDENVLQAECRLSDILLEMGELKRAETVCHSILNRSFPCFVTYEAVLSFKFQLAKIYNKMGDFKKAKEILEFVAAEMETKFGFSAEKTLRVHTELVRALHGLGDRDTVARCRQIEDEISWRESNGSPRSLWTLELVEVVAQQLYESGAYVEAENCFRNKLEYLRGKIPFTSHPKVVLAEFWVAKALYRQDKFKDAAVIYEKSLAILKDALGPHHRDTLICMSNLAFALQEQLPFAEFETRICEVHYLSKSYLGEDDPDTLSSEMFCARLMATRGEWDDSLAAFERLHKIQIKIYKTMARPEIIHFLLERSKILSLKREDSTAEKMQRQALALGQHLFGADHPRALEALVPLAYSLSRRSLYSEAETLLSGGIVTLRGSLGKQHPRVMKLELARADILAAQEQYAEAAIHQSQVLKEYSVSYGDHHPYVIDVKERLAQSYASQKMIVEAISQLEYAIHSCRLTFGPDHRRALYLNLSLASLFENQGKLKQALCLGQKVLEQVNTSLGYIEVNNGHSYLEHPGAIAALENLVDIHLDLGDIAESIDLIEKILYPRTELQGPNHPNSIAALRKLASAHCEAHECYIAEQLYRQVLEKYSAVFGDWDSQTISARIDLGDCMCHLEMFSECKALYAKMLDWLFDHHGENHKYIAKIYKKISDLCLDEGELAKGERYLKNALRIYKKLGSNKVVSVMMIELCCYYVFMEEYSRAEIHAKETIRYVGTTLGEHHTLFTKARIILAEVLLRSHKHFQANIILQSLRQDIENYEGQDGSNLLIVERQYAESMLGQGQVQDAEAFLESCINRRKHIDVRNPDLRKLKLLLDVIREEQRRPEEEETML